jgi:hypothetical protein
MLDAVCGAWDGCSLAFFEAVGTLSTSSVTYQTSVLARFANILSSQKQKAWANEAVINGNSSTLL